MIFFFLVLNIDKYMRLAEAHSGTLIANDIKIKICLECIFLLIQNELFFLAKI